MITFVMAANMNIQDDHFVAREPLLNSLLALWPGHQFICNLKGSSRFYEAFPDGKNMEQAQLATLKDTS